MLGDSDTWPARTAEPVFVGPTVVRGESMGLYNDMGTADRTSNLQGSLK